MKKQEHIRYFTLLLLVLSSMIAPYRGYCQVEKGQSEIVFGFGYKSAFEMLTDINAHNNYSFIPIPSISYRYYLTKNFTLGMNCTYQYLANNDLYAGSGVYRNSDVSTLLYIAPEITFSYSDKIVGKNKNRLRLYGLISLGITIIHEVDYLLYSGSELLPGIQLTPIGARYGKDLAGFCELGIGNKGLINLGISYRMSNKRHKHLSNKKEQ